MSKEKEEAGPDLAGLDKLRRGQKLRILDKLEQLVKEETRAAAAAGLVPSGKGPHAAWHYTAWVREREEIIAYIEELREAEKEKESTW